MYSAFTIQIFIAKIHERFTIYYTSNLQGNVCSFWCWRVRNTLINLILICWILWKLDPIPISAKNHSASTYLVSIFRFSSLHWREKRRSQLMDDGLDGDQQRTARTFKIVWNVGRQLSPPATAAPGERGLTLEIVPVLVVCVQWSSEPNIKKWAVAQLIPIEYSVIVGC